MLVQEKPSVIKTYEATFPFQSGHLMGFIEYLNSITFRFIKPLTPWFPLSPAAFTPWRRFGTFLESFNTVIPSREWESKQNLRKMCNIPRMSTLAIGALINKGVSQMPEDESFVNVGVWHGFTLLSGMVNNAEKRCIGVDNFSEFGNPEQAFLNRFDTYKKSNHFFYEIDYLDYFSSIHQEKIGFYIYDGCHDYNNQIRGLKVAEPFFSQNAIILIDDINYDDVRKATMDFIDASSYEYKVLFEASTYCNHHPTFWNGVMLLQIVN
ncbi:MAG: class I SAM-dependent methyltransferase [Thermodesulfobacteriota bacterium]